MPAQKPISILVVDDVPNIRDVVKIIFLYTDYARVVGEASNGQEAIEMTNVLNPDIVLMDIEMPVMNGIEAAKIIHQQHRETKIVMLTACSDDALIFTSFAAGADGYILKDKFPDTIEAAIAVVRLGSVWLDPAIARHILEIAARSTPSETNINQLLTQEEKEKLGEVSMCRDSHCLVDSEFIANLRRLGPAKTKNS